MFMAVNPGPLPGVQPLKPEPQHPVPIHFRGRAGKYCFTLTSVMNSFHFASQALVALLLSEILKLLLPPPPPPMRGFLRVWRLFLFHNSVPRVQVPVSKSFVSSLSLFFALPHSEDIGLPFWKPVVCCQLSVGVVSHADVNLMCFWGGTRSFHLTPLPCWKVPCLWFK